VEIEGDIVGKFQSIKEICDTCSANINKSGKTTMDDVFQMYDLIEEIQGELEDIKDSLFDLEDRIEMEAEEE
jgi:hypothetical protein